ncbi:MAG: M23 family peptidase [Flavobacterium sp.]|nr:M23 family peptidase [Flavobacterium sp.]
MKRLILIISVLLTIGICCTNSVMSENQEKSDYVLPFPIGQSYICMTTWNTPPSHIGEFKYGVDFAMTIGTQITAAREGTVVYKQERYTDDDNVPGHENYVIVDHLDSTFARYVHITQNGARVNIGQQVKKGDLIALSGNSGSSGPPHLHFDVTKGSSIPGTQTIQVWFKNTKPHPSGLVLLEVYKAEKY